MRERASAGATTSTSPPGPARYSTSSTTARPAQVSLAITRIRRGLPPGSDAGRMAQDCQTGPACASVPRGDGRRPAG